MNGLPILCAMLGVVVAAEPPPVLTNGRSSYQVFTGGQLEEADAIRFA